MRLPQLLETCPSFKYIVLQTDCQGRFRVVSTSTTVLWWSAHKHCDMVVTTQILEVALTEGHTCLQGYRLGDAQMQFTITVEVTVSGGGGNSTQYLSLTPSTPSVLSAAGNMSAQLLGDLASYSASPDFGFAILMIPSPTGATGGLTLNPKHKTLH